MSSSSSSSNPSVDEFIVNFLAGGVSGAVAKTATAPIERVKLLMQTQDANPRIVSGEVQRYNGIVDCFVRVAREQGIMAFWRGNLTNIIRYFPTQAFNFAFKDSIKAMFPKVDKEKEFGKFFFINMASGGLAGAGSILIVYPLDYARVRLATDVGSGKRQFSGLFDCLFKTVKSSGFFSMYNGIGVSIVGIIPYRGTYFGLYDTLSGFNPWENSDSIILRTSSKFAAAQTSAIAAGYVSYPFDTVRRRLQMQSDKPRAEWAYKNTMDCFRQIIKNEGTAALFKGAGANVLRTVGAALVLVFYSEITAFFGNGSGSGSSSSGGESYNKGKEQVKETVGELEERGKRGEMQVKETIGDMEERGKRAETQVKESIGEMAERGKRAETQVKEKFGEMAEKGKRAEMDVKEKFGEMAERGKQGVNEKQGDNKDDKY